MEQSTKFPHIQALNSKRSLNTVLTRFGNTNEILTSSVDTGARISCISQSALSKIFLHMHLCNSDIPFVRGVAGNLTRVLGQITLPVIFGNHKFDHRFYVLKHINHEVILGIAFFCSQTRLGLDLIHTVLLYRKERLKFLLVPTMMT